MNLVAAIDRFLFLPRPGSVTTVRLTLDLQTALPMLCLGTIRVFGYFVYCSLFVKGDDIFS